MSKSAARNARQHKADRSVPQLEIVLIDVTKRFTQRPIFRPVSFTANSGEIVAITGYNGSGKSTLLKIVAGVLAPSKGSCDWQSQEGKLSHEEIQRRIGYAAPYLELYDELTAVEHVQFVLTLKRSSESLDAATLLESFGLDREAIRAERRLRAFSSGMKQRVRLAMAFAATPDVICLDEPTSTLDEQGSGILFEKIRHAASQGSIVLLATNMQQERALASREIHLEAA